MDFGARSSVQFAVLLGNFYSFIVQKYAGVDEFADQLTANLTGLVLDELERHWMAPTDPEMIGNDSAAIARLERLIKAEEGRIEELSNFQSLFSDGATFQRWLAARGRLRELMKELLRVHGFSL